MRDNFNIADWRIQYLNGELLTESDAKIDQTKKIIRKIFSDLLDLEGPVSGSDYYVDGKQDTTWMQYLVWPSRGRPRRCSRRVRWREILLFSCRLRQILRKNFRS